MWVCVLQIPPAPAMGLWRQWLLLGRVIFNTHMTCSKVDWILWQGVGRKQGTGLKAKLRMTTKCQAGC